MPPTARSLYRFLTGHPRGLFATGVAVTMGLISAALLMQEGFGLDPCPLCILQRVAVMVYGGIALLGILVGVRSPAVRRLLSGMLALVALIGAGLAGRHLWLQHLPADRIPACGPDLDYMLDTFPLGEALGLILRGSGECAEVQGTFLGLSIPGWTLLAFCGLAALAVRLWCLRPPTSS